MDNLFEPGVRAPMQPVAAASACSPGRHIKSSVTRGVRSGPGAGGYSSRVSARSSPGGATGYTRVSRRPGGIVDGERQICSVGHARLNSVAGCSLGRVVEEELIAIRIIDHQKTVAPRTLLDRNAFGLEFRAQRVQHRDLLGDRCLARLPLGVDGNEHQALANLLGPRVGQNQGAALPVDLCNARSAVLLVAPDRKSVV